jgi:hypothetical protein
MIPGTQECVPKPVRVPRAQRVFSQFSARAPDRSLHGRTTGEIYQSTMNSARENVAGLGCGGRFGG